MRPRLLVPLAALAVLVAAALPGTAARASASAVKGYLVVLTDAQPSTPGFQISEADRQAALGQIAAAGGTVANDWSKTIGVVRVGSALPTFASTVEASAVVETAGRDFAFKAVPSYEEALAGGLTVLSHPDGNDAPDPAPDPLEAVQWNMQMIRTEEAHAIQAGIRAVEVGILDTGIDGYHPDFRDGLESNVNCAKGRDSIGTLADVLALDPVDVGSPDPCVDNGFHGTHVAGIVGARANGVGIVGVAPNVELIPVKVCDTTGHCYASAVVDGIEYSARMRFEVINMSLFVDDDSFLQSTEFKCSSDPVQRTFRQAVERAIQFARNQGVLPVAALGNSANDLAHPPEPYENECDVVPAETQGVVGVSALGNDSTLTSYSNYGDGMNDVSAPGGRGTGNCLNAVPSTFPVLLGAYACISGTSMASPHAAGVAALIVSQFGKAGSSFDHDGNPLTPPLPDWEMRPQQVENYLQGSAVDIGLKGYDTCYGNGRIDALRAVTHETSSLYEPRTCMWYATQP